MLRFNCVVSINYFKAADVLTMQQWSPAEYNAFAILDVQYYLTIQKVKTVFKLFNHHPPTSRVFILLKYP